MRALARNFTMVAAATNKGGLVPDHSMGPLTRTAFRVDVLPEREAPQIVPVGMLDDAGAAELVKQLQELRDAGFPRLVLDLRRLQTADAAAVETLIAEIRSVISAGDLSLIGAEPALLLAAQDGVSFDRDPLPAAATA